MATIGTDPAFPVQKTDQSTGLTKREWLAGRICAGMQGGSVALDGAAGDPILKMVRKAVAIADALILELNKPR